MFDKIHPLSADLPEECTFALERNFLQYYIHLRLAALHEFADYYYSRTRRDMIETYSHYKETLQLITYKGKVSMFPVFHRDYKVTPLGIMK